MQRRACTCYPSRYPSGNARLAVIARVLLAPPAPPPFLPLTSPSDACGMPSPSNCLFFCFRAAHLSLGWQQQFTSAQKVVENLMAGNAPEPAAEGECVRVFVRAWAPCVGSTFSGSNRTLRNGRGYLCFVGLGAGRKVRGSICNGCDVCSCLSHGRLLHFLFVRYFFFVLTFQDGCAPSGESL